MAPVAEDLEGPGCSWKEAAYLTEPNLHAVATVPAAVDATRSFSASTHSSTSQVGKDEIRLELPVPRAALSTRSPTQAPTTLMAPSISLAPSVSTFRSP